MLALRSGVNECVDELSILANSYKQVVEPASYVLSKQTTGGRFTFDTPVTSLKPCDRQSAITQSGTVFASLSPRDN